MQYELFFHNTQLLCFGQAVFHSNPGTEYTRYARCIFSTVIPNPATHLVGVNRFAHFGYFSLH